MLILVIGLIAFIAIHMIPSFPDLRGSLRQKLGASGYLIVFSLASLAAFGLIIYGKANAQFQTLYSPPLWGRHVAWVLVPISFVLLAGAYLPGNIKRFTAHPMLWGVVIWSIAHLLANGDLASVFLFGGFGLFALVAMYSAQLRGATKSDVRQPVTKDLTVLIIGLVAAVVVMRFHANLFKVAIF